MNDPVTGRQLTGLDWFEKLEDGGEGHRELRLGDTVFYHRFHNNEWVISTALVVQIFTTRATGLWVFSHPIPHEATPAFWRPNVPYLQANHPAPADGSHYWSFR